MSVKLQFGSFNARGLNNTFKRRETFLWLKNKKCNIVFLQETHSTKNLEFQWRSEWGGKICFSHGTSQARGVAILLGRNLAGKILEVDRDMEGRFVIVKLEIEKKRILLVNVYGPNTDDPEFFCTLFKKLQNFTMDHVIMGGDFNTVLDYTVDKSDMTKHRNSKAAEYINSCIETSELLDIWRELYPERHGFTWHKKNPNNLHERLDWFLISTELQQIVESMDIRPGLKSDHQMVTLVITLENFVRGPGFWKFNTSLLKDRDFIEKMNNLIEIELAQEYESKLQHWEIFKFAIQTSARQYSINKKKSRENKFQALERKLEYHTRENESGFT